MNKTGMSEYIPEYYLVYIASHRDFRGKGIGKELIKSAVETTGTDFALHVEHDNETAIKFYEKLGLTSKYLEMRWERGVSHGVS